MIVGAVLAGGRSVRFGAPKAGALLAGRPLLAHVADRLTGGCEAVALAGGEAGLPWDGLRLGDAEAADVGPLSGVLAGLEWAENRGATWLATAPCDTPLLPKDLVTRLMAGVQAARAPLCIAVSPGGRHPLCAVWSVALRARLEAQLRLRHPPIHAFAREAGAVEVAFDDESAFLNVNTREDLARAEGMVGGGG